MNKFEYLYDIQKNLKAPKNQRNKFGNYNYRSCEDIVDAVKKEMPTACALVMSDEVILVGERIYVKATVTLHTPDGDIIATGLAREDESKKGFDSAQLTGSTSSYARKYALNGLFAIDDTKDSDSNEMHQEVSEKAKNPVVNTKLANMAKGRFQEITESTALAEKYDEIKAHLVKVKANELTQKAIEELYNARSEELLNENA